jgi:hypothetical protein
MAISRLLPSGGNNDFNVAISGTYTSITFDKEYPQGAYSIVSSAADTSFDIYAYNSNGTLVAYASTPSLNASSGFIKLVILGGTTGDLLSFSYKTTYASVSDNDEVTAGPFVLSANSTSLPSVNSSITITGGNFATDITATFTGTGYAETSAKSVTRNSVTQVVVVRPDTLPISGSPYTLKLSNPGVTNPTGSNPNLLTVNAGSVPTWTTGTTLPSYTRNVAYSTTVIASDPDGGSISYSSVGSMPTGLSIDSTSGVISGTSTVAVPLSFSIRATDLGGNFTDRAFTLPNAGPVWTSSGTLTSSQVTISYSLQLIATDDSGVAPTNYTLSSGSLPAGITLSSSGLLSGTPTTAGTYTFSVNASDGNSVSTNSGTLTIVTNPAPLRGLIVAGGGGGGNGQPNNVGGTGGGAGGYREVVITYDSATTYNVSVGGGGAQATGTSGGSAQRGSNGGNSFIGTSSGNVSATGGGGGGEWCGSGVSGGSGGGGSGCGQGGGAGNAGGYSPSEGNNGGAGGNQQNGGSGGGALAAGGAGGGYASGATPTYFTGATYSTGGPGATNGTPYSPSGNRGSGGAGQWFGGGSAGGSAGVGGAVGLFVPNGYASVTTTGSPTVSAVTGGTTYIWTGAGTWRIG